MIILEIRDNGFVHMIPMDLYNLRGFVRNKNLIWVEDNQGYLLIANAILIYSSGESGFAMDKDQNIYTFTCQFSGNDRISDLKEPSNYSATVNKIIPFTLGNFSSQFDDSQTPDSYILNSDIQSTHSLHQIGSIKNLGPDPLLIDSIGNINSFDSSLIDPTTSFATVETISSCYNDENYSGLGMQNSIQQYLFYNGTIYCRQSIDKNTWSSWVPVLKNDGTLYEPFSDNYQSNGSITTDWGSINYLYNQKNRFLSTLKLKVNIDYIKAYSSLSYGVMVPLFNLVNYFDTSGVKSEPNIIAFLKYLLSNNLLPQSSATAVNEDGKGNLVKVGFLGSDVGTDDNNISVPNYGELMLSPLIIGSGTSSLKNQSSTGGYYENSNSSFVIVLTANGFDSTIAKEKG